MGPEEVPFPQDCPNWALVRDLLTELQERLLNETINAHDAAMHIEMVYEACQATQPLEEHSIQRDQGSRSQARQGARQKLDQSYLWFGVLKFLKKVDQEEREKFLFTTMPNIIELALRVEESMPPTRLCFSQQQKGGSTVLSRQFIASVLACSFLCLFPERVRDRISKLNVINFTHFFKQLPQVWQIAKLRCFLHYFERTVEAGLERQGSIVFHRQVAERSMLPTLEELLRSETALCSLTIHSDGAMEDVCSSAMQVDFANRSIGGGVLGRGKVQEEIRFCTCPELITAMLFMETMEDNEAIIISGFEQFSLCTGYAASLQFAGPFYDKAKRDSSGNLQNTMCAIDATSFRWGGRHRQFQDVFLMREINKALVGFSRVEQHRSLRLGSVTRGTSSEWEEEFVTASESLDEECTEKVPVAVNRMAEVMAKSLLSQGMVQAVRALQGEGDGTVIVQGLEDVEPLILDDMSLLSASSENPLIGQSSSTPREEEGQGSQVVPVHGHGAGGNGERLSLPMVVPRPQNGSCDILEVDYSEWLANFRRRSSQLSDLTSRRSSSSTKHSSEFSSDLEEIYETLVQAEKGQHGIIEEETYGAALSEYAAHFVTSLMSEGTSVAAQMLPGMKEFQQGEPPAGTLKPQVVRPTAVRFIGESASPHVTSLNEYVGDWRRPELSDENHDSSDEDDSISGTKQPQAEVEVPPVVKAYAESVVSAAIQNGVAEAAAYIQDNVDEAEDNIPDDVYRWFADKIVQEVFAHVVDELYFQRFTSDSRWRADLAVNREGVQQRHDLSDSDSVSSSSSGSEAHQGSSDLHSPSTASRSSDLQSGLGLRREGSDLQRNHAASSDLLSGHSSPLNKASSHSGLSSSSADSVDHRFGKKKSHVRRTHSQSSDSESVETRERKSVTFTVDTDKNRDWDRPRLDRDRPWSEWKAGAASDMARYTSQSGRLSPRQKLSDTARHAPKSPTQKVSSCSKSSGSQWFVVKAVPIPSTRPLTTSRPAKKVSSPRSDISGSKSVTETARGVQPRELGAQLSSRSGVQKPTSSTSSFITITPASSIPTSPSKTTETPSPHSPSVVSATHPPPLTMASSFSYHYHPPSSSSVCDSPYQSADSGYSAPSDLPSTHSVPGAAPSSSDISAPVPSSPGAFTSVSSTAGADDSVSSPRVVASISRPGAFASTLGAPGASLPSTPGALISLPFSSDQQSGEERTAVFVPSSTSAFQSTPMSRATADSPLSSPRHVAGSGGQSSPRHVAASSSKASLGHLAGSGQTSPRHLAAGSGPSSPRHVTTGDVQAAQAVSESGVRSEEGDTASLSEQDLNLDCYRVAAAIVNQVFQSLPDHFTESELQSMRGSPSSFYYHGRKYESIYPRGSYETAAAVIGASEKGNVVSESYMQNKKVTGVTTSETTSPRRTRSQSPCFSWLSKRLSRETLTNAFVKVESRHSVKSYERRSSEPCQRSVTLSLQAFNTSHYGYMGDRLEDKQRKNARTDDDLDKVKAESWRRGSLDSISLSQRRNSFGFQDPVLSRFAQELITADTSVPQLFLVGSGSNNSSTTGSRRSSLSGFRDTTLATFESELLNSSFTLSQAPTSPRNRRPKRSHSRESRLWKSDSSETEYWFPIPRRVGLEFQEQMERVHRHYSVDEIEDYADFVATTILQQAVGILCHDMEEMTPQDDDIDIYSENLADQILRDAMVTSAKLASGASASGDHRGYGKKSRGKAKSVSDSELDFSISSNDLTARCLEDRLADFQDALDVSYSSVDMYAGNLAHDILTAALHEFGSHASRLVPGGRTIATGNWGCGALCGDPGLKAALQWVAASLAKCPHLHYYTFHDQRLEQLPSVVELLLRRQWTVGQLMTAVKTYCALLLDEVSYHSDESDTVGAVGGGGDRESFVPRQTLFEFLLSQF